MDGRNVPHVKELAGIRKIFGKKIWNFASFYIHNQILRLWVLRIQDWY